MIRRRSVSPGAGPVEEPVTVAHVKALARHDRTDEDALIDTFIRAARQQVERDTDLTLIATEWQMLVDAAPGDVITLPHGPLSSVVSLQSSAPLTTYPVNLVHADASPPVIYLPTSSDPAWAAATPAPPTSAPTQWGITWLAGAPDAASVPPLLTFAVGLLAAHYLTLGRDLAVVGSITNEIPNGYAEAINAFRMESLA